MAAGRWKCASSLLLVALTTALVLRWCPRTAETPAAPPATIAIAALQEGDLIFRRGQGLWSDRFAEASAHGRRFTHVGMLLRADETWQVAHASADDRTGVGRTEAEPLETFLREASAVEIRRPRLAPAPLGLFVGAVRSATVAHTPFDPAFSLATPERVYCTELIWQAWFRATGVDPLPRKTLWRGHTIVSIEDVLCLGDIVPAQP